MVRRTTHAYNTTIVASCPKCRVRLKLFRSSIPQIDSCGFESYSFRCTGCASSLAGIIDPSDDELLVSLLEPTSSCERSSRERVDYQTKPIFSTAREHSPSDTSRERTRCNANRSICAGVLIVTKVMVGRCTASAIGTALIEAHQVECVLADIDADCGDCGWR
jgi:hypothetical protein